MTRAIDSLSEVADQFEAIVLDQWGVLHDGTMPYPGAIDALSALKTPLAVLSNSGKRAAPNAHRIVWMGFPEAAFDVVMTSGEALWREIDAGVCDARRLVAITRDAGDAQAWAEGLDVSFTDDVAEADAILLMGLPDGAEAARFAPILDAAHDRGLTVFCTNPDRASPRAGGLTVTSPGALAHDYADRGGHVQFYGKPHRPVFDAVASALGAAPDRLLMVGDSLEHDIAGGHAAGWSTAFVRNGLHAAAFADGAELDATLAALAEAEGAPMPTFTLAQLG